MRLVLHWVLFAVCWSHPVAHAYEGESMAPGLARLQVLTSEGSMTVMVLDKAFSGEWRKAKGDRDTRLLREHWSGTRQGLERQLDNFAVSELKSADGVPMRCEFITDPKRPTGVCEEHGSRLYYLTGGSK